MGDLRGFLKIARQDPEYRAVCERIKDYGPVSRPRPEKLSMEQASRCMDCGTPFCHWGCSLGNYIPEWNDHMYRGRWEEALVLLEATNSLPEITGRVCPALCEYACVLGLNDDPVTIRENELAIVEYGFSKGLIKPRHISKRTGKRVAVIGSGPAGLSTASELNRYGHGVTVFERDELPGGILRYGIPDFKLEKSVIDRRIDIWKKEGVVFKTGVEAGREISGEKLLKDFDAILLAGGSRVPRDLKIEGRELKGIYMAMDYLTQSNRRAAGQKIPDKELINARGRKVVVIGGGDTGSDCVGTANRQGASCVVQVEVLPRPGECRGQDQPWPCYPSILKTTSSHEEGCERRWEVSTKRFTGERGALKKLVCGRGTEEFELEADMAILAIGFLHPERSGLIEQLGVELDNRGNVKTDSRFITSVDKVFSAGDMRRGQSLVVWAISEGMAAAGAINNYLVEKIDL